MAGTLQAVAAWWTFQVRAFTCDDSCPSLASSRSSFASPALPLSTTSPLPPAFGGELDIAAVLVGVWSGWDAGVGRRAGGLGGLDGAAWMGQGLVEGSVVRALEAGEVAGCDPTLGYEMQDCCFDQPLGCPTRSASHIPLNPKP